MSAAESIERFRQLLRIPTVSRADASATDWGQFDLFVATVENLYPRVHASLTREVVAGHSLLYRWAGREHGNPAVLMAHYDVVPATDAGWRHPPFAATLIGEGDEQLLWGRGTIDDKGALVSVLEAVEARRAAGFTPRNDIYLSFGHDEETAGTGAAAIVARLAAQSVAPALVLDEGGAVVENIFPGVAGPIGVVGVSEKGTVSVQLRVTQQGGHASTPPKDTATARLARAIVRLDRTPFGAYFSPPTLAMIRTLGARARQPYRFLFRNLWLTRMPLLAVFARLGDETNAMVRTTMAVTELSGSAAANVLAESATATVNIRVAVGSTTASAVDRVHRAIADPLVEISTLHSWEPSPVSPNTGAAWDAISSSIEQTFAGAVVTPYVQLGASDSRHFTAISRNVYRFSPFELTAEQRGALHAIDERISVSTWLRGIAFYETLITKL
jgi:carboxypeptidase PM20D1